MSESAPRRPSLDQLRRQAKALLRQYQAGEEAALRRFAAANPRPSGARRSRPVSLADAQFVLAREHGFETWTALKRRLEDVGSRRERYRRFADDVALAAAGDAEAPTRLTELFGEPVTSERLTQQIQLRLGDVAITPEIARRFLARRHGFDDWEGFAATFDEVPSRLSVHGLSATPPFYRVENGTLEPFPPVSLRDWEEIFEVMRASGITALRAGRHMTDAALARLARLDFVTSLEMEGSTQVTDAGLAHLGGMRLRRLNLTGCSITDDGLAVLRRLPELREFSLFHYHGVSDAGLAHLGFCPDLERVSLLGSAAGDGVIRALVAKPKLRYFQSGDHATDEGLEWLHHFPVFKTWQGGEPEFTLMGFDAEPNYLLLRGRITDRGMASLQGLDGLFALNLDDSRLSITADGVRSLAGLPNLGWLGFDATDETMGAIGELPRLRFLMCQDTRATDAGFAALSRSRSLEYLWGRRCYGLTGAGFRAMARMPALRGLSASCRNVDDAALATLPHFPALDEFMPMDVPDDGFRHVGRCERLEAVWCMYCRDTGDAATEHLASLNGLKTYYAGQTQITDRSLEILSGMPSIESLTFSLCRGVTDAGVSALAALPRLRELRLELMPRVSRKALASIPAHVKVSYET